MSQATTWGLQTSGPASAFQYSARANASLDALMTQHSGNARPAYLTYGPWIRTTSSLLHELFFYTGTGDILLASINPIDGSVAWNGSGAQLQNTQNVRVIFASDAAVLESGTTYYFGPRGFSFVEADQAFSFPFAFNMKNLKVFSGPAPGLVQSVITTLRKNNADTALTAMVLDSSQQGINSTNSIACASGDLLSFEVQTSAGAAALRVAVSAELEIL